jgi:D-arginine dehydrogenase
MPLVIHIGGDFYFKPDVGGQLWLSPHDETPSEPCDAAPEELDVALAIDRFTQVADYQIEAVTHKWAGLRTFAPDRLPVYGFDAQAPEFFWCAGQGGFGIQTAPAAAQLCAAAILKQPLPSSLDAVEPARFHPARFNL